MHFVRYIYSWSKYPNTDALPDGRFVINLGFNQASVAEEQVEQCAEIIDIIDLTGYACAQLDIPEEEWDLYYKETDSGPKTLLTEDVIYPDFVWESLKDMDIKTVYYTEEQVIQILEED